MAKHPFPVFDGDGHVLENDDEMALYYEGKYKDLRLFKTYGIWPSLDGWARGFIVGNEDQSRKYVHTDAEVWREMVGLPSRISDTSVEVPPMSKPSASG